MRSTNNREKTEMRLGKASIFVELTDGEIIVWHGEDRVVLHRVKAIEGMWETMFDAICGVLYAMEEDN